jgi:hypothetical protein
MRPSRPPPSWGGRPCIAGSAARATPLRSLAPRPDGCRSPGPCPPVVRAARRSKFAWAVRPLQGFLPRPGSHEGLKIPHGCFPRVGPPRSSPPPCWLRLLSRGLPPACFLLPRPSARRARHPGVSSDGGIGWPFPAADLPGFRDPKVAEVAHTRLRILKASPRLLLRWNAAHRTRRAVLVAIRTRGNSAEKMRYQLAVCGQLCRQLVETRSSLRVERWSTFRRSSTPTEHARYALGRMVAGAAAP